MAGLAHGLGEVGTGLAGGGGEPRTSRHTALSERPEALSRPALLIPTNGGLSPSEAPPVVSGPFPPEEEPCLEGGERGGGGGAGGRH